MKAFTMAEVLITIGIIGVVAAMTLPGVIKNYERKETETRLQRAYSIINQAFMAAQAKHGEIKDWPEWDDAEFILEHYIKPEIKEAKVYPSSDSIYNLMCFDGDFPGNYQNGNDKSQYGWMDNVYMTTPFLPNKTASIKLMDGTCIGLNPIYPNYTSYSKRVFIDTNGSYKRPNKAGIDLFFYIVDENRIMPYGYEKSLTEISDKTKTNSCHLQATLGGYYCAAKIMAEGWKINYW